jgi:hypothetical protein
VVYGSAGDVVSTSRNQTGTSLQVDYQAANQVGTRTIMLVRPDGASTPASYADAYTIKNSAGQCLQAGDPNVDRTVVLATCAGGDDQKWNAPARAGSSLMTQIGES